MPTATADSASLSSQAKSWIGRLLCSRRFRRGLLLIVAAKLYIVALLYLSFLCSSPPGTYNAFLFVPEGQSREERLEEIAGCFFSRLAPFDGQFYLDISYRGYERPEPSKAGGTVSYKGTYAFFPMLPGILWVCQRLFADPVPWTIALNFLLSVVGLSFVWLFARYMHIDSRLTILFCLAFPSALFQSLLYTESLFLFISAALWMCILKQRWGSAAILGYMGGLCRPQGILLTLLFLSAFRNPRRTRGGSHLNLPPWIAAATPLLGLGTFMFINLEATDSPFAFLHAQSGWGREVGVAAVARAFQELWARSGTLPDILGTAFGVLLLPIIWRTLPKPLAIYATAIVCMPLATGKILSMGRFISVSFPHLLCLAGLLRGRRFVAWVLLIAFAALQLLALKAIMMWQFIG